MVYDEQDPGDGGELEENAPIGMFILSVLDLVVEEHDACSNQVCRNSGTNVTQGILIQRTPWRVGSSKKDGLCHSQQAIGL